MAGDDLAQALEGVDLVIDVSKPMPADGSDMMETVSTAARNLVGACAAQGVQRLVMLTIAGIEKPVFDRCPYYAARRAAKEIVLNGPVPATIVKSTHWYEFAANPAVVAHEDREVVVQDWLIQPIAVDTVADVLVESALGQTHAPLSITGPRAIRLPELTSRLLARQGDRRRVRVEQPALSALALGALRASDRAVVLGPDVDTWLQTLAPAGAPGRVPGEQSTEQLNGHTPDLTRV